MWRLESTYMICQNVPEPQNEIKKSGYILGMCPQTVDKALLLQGFAIVGTAFLI